MAYFIPDEEKLDPVGLDVLQREKLASMLDEVLATNKFYQQQYAGLSFNAIHDDLEILPFTLRSEIQQDQLEHPPYGSNLTYPLPKYCRLHQTSGSMGTPLRWLDTAESWSWWQRCWGILYRAAGVTREDRFMFPSTFGPFVGWWGGFDGATALGNFAIAGGGMTTVARLRSILEYGITFVGCTPSYALRLAEVADQHSIDLANSNVRGLIVAGEPGGSIATTRAKIEAAWGARVFDHAGLTEVGPWGFECVESPMGGHAMESEYIVEVIDPQSSDAVAEGEIGELVLTNLGRVGSPLIRYRTGDLVRLIRKRCACGRWFARLDGGILGRSDDMLLVRGNNVFPSVVEGILRGFDQVAEFAIDVKETGSMTDLVIAVEPVREGIGSGLVDAIIKAFRDQLHFRPKVSLVKPGALPRFDGKAKRIVRHGFAGGKQG